MATTDVVLRLCVEIWKSNDPADSKSGEVPGQMRRLGRRDTAIKVMAKLLGREEADVKSSLEAGEW